MAKTIQYIEGCTWKHLRNKYGRDICLRIRKRNGEWTRLDFSCPPLTRSPMAFRGAEKVWDPLAVKDWKISTLSALGQNCANCGTLQNIEMHHVKQIRTINPSLGSFDRMMARINRKQVPLCRVCHRKVHAGRYAGMSLRHFK